MSAHSIRNKLILVWDDTHFTPRIVNDTSRRIVNQSAYVPRRRPFKYYVTGLFSEKLHQGGGDRVRGCTTHLLSITNLNVGGFHVSVIINI